MTELAHAVVLVVLGLLIVGGVAARAEAATTLTPNYDTEPEGVASCVVVAFPADLLADHARAPSAADAIHDYGDRMNIARTSARPGAEVVAPNTTDPDCDDGAELFHGTDIDAARGIVANGFSVAAAREAGGDGRFYLTDNFSHAVVFAQSNPRDRDPAVVRARLSVTVEQAVATGLLRPEPLPGAYTVGNLAGFEAITTYSLIEL